MRRLNEKGAVTALVAIMLVLIIACVALVVDLGHVHNVKGQLQKAVDAAALAAARHLGGSPTEVDDAKAAAIATADANGVTEVVFVDADCETSATESCVGTWDGDDKTKSAGERFTQTEDNPNAVLVRATRNVDHIFFFFSPSTQVTADAIAVAKPKLPILPLAIITCVPADEMVANPGSLPLDNVCGIADYNFGSDQNDTAAWSALSFNASGSEIIEYMSTEGGREKFNNVIFGAHIEPKGIENEEVDPLASSYSSSYDGCGTPFPYGYNINCGLGDINGDGSLALPGDFTPPSSITDLNPDPVTGIYSPTSFDPLTGFNTNPPHTLPRWYNINDTVGLQNDDYFTRVWTQDGILLPGTIGTDPETMPEYVARLGTYANCTDPGPSSCNPYGDDRFKIVGNEEHFIINPNSGHGNLPQKLEAAIGFKPDYWPDFRKVIKHAGYPKVSLINGNANTVIQAFLKNEDVTDGTNLNCSDNDPFPSGQETLRVNAPVIFAGSCEDWSAISTPSDEHGFTYIGLSKFLITRVWSTGGGGPGTPDDYDCGSNFVELNGTTCSEPFDPGLFNNNTFSLPAQSPSAHPSLLALEGLSLVPVDDDDDDQGSILDVFLVE